MFQLPFEKLTVYQFCGDFVAECEVVNQRLGKGRGRMKDQLHRAALSALLNTGEGAGDYKPRAKAYFYRVALRSVTECVGCFFAIVKLNWLPAEDLMRARELACRIYAMLTKLIHTVEARLLKERANNKKPDSTTTASRAHSRSRSPSRSRMKPEE